MSSIWMGNQAKASLHSFIKPNLFSNLLVATFPYIDGLSHKISRILHKKGLHYAFKPFATLKNYIPSLKDSKDTFLDSGVYKIVCSCGTPYIGETSCPFSTRIKEHSADIRHEWVINFFLSDHSSSTKHYICLDKTHIMCKEDNFYKMKLKEAIEINNHPSNLNRDEGWKLSQSWHPLLANLRSHHLPSSC